MCGVKSVDSSTTRFLGANYCVICRCASSRDNKGHVSPRTVKTLPFSMGNVARACGMVEDPLDAKNKGSCSKHMKNHQTREKSCAYCSLYGPPGRRQRVAIGARYARQLVGKAVPSAQAPEFIEVCTEELRISVQIGCLTSREGGEEVRRHQS